MLDVRVLPLGISAGAPTKVRHVSAYAIDCANEAWILFDCGEGTQMQILRSHLPYRRLQAVIISHLHGDHFFGLLGLLSSLSLYGRKEALYLLAPKALESWLLEALSFSGITLNYPLYFSACEEGAFTLPLTSSLSLEIKIYPLLHRVPSYGFACTLCRKKKVIDTNALYHLGIEKRNWHAYAKAHPEFYLHKEERMRFVLAGDNAEPERLMEACREALFLLHEATYTDLILQKIKTRFDPMHSSAKMVAEFAQKVALPHLLLGHFSARYVEETQKAPLTLQDIFNEAKYYYDGDLILAEELKEYVFQK